MSTYTLFGKEVSFSEAADRYFYILKAFELAAEKASEQFKNFYHDAGNISNVLDGYMKAVYTLTKNWAIDPLYASLKNAEIYDVSEDSFQNACWDLEGAEQYYDCIAEKYNEIVGDLADAKQYRALRKASRSKYGWMSSTEWADMTNAAITAGALNAMSGIGHSIRNGIGNLGSSISAAASKKSLYDNEKTLEILDDGVFECIKSIYLLYMEFVNAYKENEGEDVWYDGSPYDSEKADVLLKNSSEVEGKEKELLFRAFSVCPYHYLVSATIFIKYEEERKNIFQIAKKYKNDLTPLLAQVIQSVYTEDAKESEEKAQEAKQKIRGIMKEYDIAENETLDQIEYDCLVRLCEPYKDYLPGENQALLDAIVAYDATDDNKSAVVEELRIWELAEKYGVEFDDDEKEEIIAAFIEHAENEEGLDRETILEKATLIMEGLELEESDSLDDFEYDVLDEFASQYDELPVGEADPVLQQIVSCFVSDSIKHDYIYENNIWELAKHYDVEFADENKAIIVYSAFDRMMGKDADENNVIVKLTAILKALDIMDDTGTIPCDWREVLFKLLSGMEEAKRDYENSVKGTASGAASAINNDIEAIISATGITFMTTSLTYRKDQVIAAAQKLKYCTLVADEYPIMIYDAHPVMNAYAYGFCLTDKRLVAKQEGSRFEVKIEDIVSFEKKGFLSSKVLVHTRTGVRELEVDNLSELQKFAECLNRVIKALPESQKNEKEKNGAFYKEYIDRCVSAIEENVFLVKYFAADNIVSDIYSEKAKLASVAEAENNSLHDDAVETKASSAKEDSESQIDSTLKEKIMELVRSGNKLEAIKLLRENTGVGLAEAKLEVEKIAKQVIPEKATRSDNPPTAPTRETVIVARDNEPQKARASTSMSGKDLGTKRLNSRIGSIDQTKPLDQQLADLLAKYGADIKSRIFLTGTATFEKKIRKAIAAYAPICSTERALLMEDATIFGSAKEGCVWTTEKVYIKETLTPKASLSIYDIKEIRYTEKSKALYDIELITTAATAHTVSFRSTAEDAKKVAEFYNDALLLIMAHTKANAINVTETTVSTGKAVNTEKWLCQCGAMNSGMFCPDCGKPKDTGVPVWTCSCGSVNTGKFCPNCGTPKQ